MSHPKANMWRTQQPLTAPPRGVKLKANMAPSSTTGRAPSPNVATAIAEARFGSRADKLLRRFSWEDGGDV